MQRRRERAVTRERFPRVCLHIWRSWEQTQDKRNKSWNTFPRLFTYLTVLETNAG
ncbi:hypothetical protein HMPREF1581_01391 [Gardnerella vaginalis JCP8108]|uniref:Uncharacterized protein n=1 Tax=Gardnerella vaginalis JCP8108 TaxID=1261066 RepID=S4GKD6_GARVA|nr:hypothetical protein HMPREF1581_01391 [Gardnerella vaginalis JCP8108]